MEYKRTTLLNSRGFTLIEVVAVLVIISILAVVAVSRVGNTITTAENSADLETLKSHLRYAQIRALNTDGVWGIDFTGNTYHIYKKGDVTAYSFPGESGTNVEKPSSITYSAYISFDEWGRPFTDQGASIPLAASPAGFASVTITPETGFVP